MDSGFHTILDSGFHTIVDSELAGGLDYRGKIISKHIKQNQGKSGFPYWFELAANFELSRVRVIGTGAKRVPHKHAWIML